MRRVFFSFILMPLFLGLALVVALVCIGTSVQASSAALTASALDSPHGAPSTQAGGNENWDSRFGPPGTNAMVSAITVSGSDIYVAGGSTAGGTMSYGVMKWDPSQSSWSPLGGGITHAGAMAGSVSAIVVNGSDVYVGGGFTHAGGVPANNVARWDGSQWHSLGTGANNGVGGPVYALAVSGNDVYVGGIFTQAGGAPANRVARWDGSQWHPLAGGIAGPGSPVVWALATMGSDLLVGGDFREVNGQQIEYFARWDGSQWFPMGGAGSTVWAIVVDGPFIYIGGGMTGGIRRWDGTQWSTLGGGTGGGPVYDIALNGSNVYIGGAFFSVGGVTAYNVAHWDGSQWHSLGTGPNNGTSDSVNTVAFSNGSLYVGGRFVTAGTVGASRVARWDTGQSQWHALLDDSSNGVASSDFLASVNSVAAAPGGGDVYAGGNFNVAGDLIATGIARWDGTQWNALGSGVSGVGSPHNVAAIVVSGTTVYAGGYFPQAGGVTVNHIARWDGSQWYALGSGIFSNASVPVRALAVVGNTLYAAGTFSSAGGQAANNIARWNGSQWQPLGTGITGCQGTGCTSVVNALAVQGNQLYVGGNFTSAGGVSVTGIAVWDTSQNQWQPLGGRPGNGVDRSVRAIAVMGTNLFVGGNFNAVEGTPTNRVARWDGSQNQWHPLDTGVTGPPHVAVNAFTVDGNDLYVGGVFTMTGSVSSNSVARWDGSQWHALGSGTIFPPYATEVFALAMEGADVYVGGNFITAGEKPANAIALWHTEACTISPDYQVTVSTGATIVPGTTYVPGSTCDACTVLINLPFSYDFYGTPYTQVRASNKGNLQFLSSNSDGNNTCLPATQLSDAIMVYWDDINTNINDVMGIYTSVSGTAPNRIFNIEWRGGFEANDATANFEARLYEGQPMYELIYGQTRGGGFSTTVGVQKGTGERVTQYSCNQIGSVPIGTRLTFDQRMCPLRTSHNNIDP